MLIAEPFGSIGVGHECQNRRGRANSCHRAHSAFTLRADGEFEPATAESTRPIASIRTHAGRALPDAFKGTWGYHFVLRNLNP
jgi:hypothetical protein